MGNSSKSVDYMYIEQPNALVAAVEDTGNSFIIGTMGGWFYHFIKSSSRQPLVSRIKFACAKSSHVGGFLGLMAALSVGIGQTVNHLGHRESPYLACLIGDSASAALMWAPKGIRSASLAALLCPSLSALLSYRKAWRESNFLAESISMYETRPYAYPQRLRPSLSS